MHGVGAIRYDMKVIKYQSDSILYGCDSMLYGCYMPVMCVIWSDMAVYNVRDVNVIWHGG